MSTPRADTIFAVAAGGRHAALTVLRLSGPRCGAIVAELGATGLRPRLASVRGLRHPGGRLLDRALVLWFPEPRSYTGEDVAELHLHGGSAVLDGVTAALTALGARPAEPGEFTRRAFLNGRIDLLEAEAVGDLVAAETETQRDQALMQMQGAQAAIYADWRQRIVAATALLEAGIDFPDEVAEAEAPDATGLLEPLITELEARLASDGFGETIRRGLTVAVVGAPNVGKSSLVNALCGRDVAIVSDIPGTTRDLVEVPLSLAGVKLTLVDTAGLREGGDAIEREGMRRARARAEAADLVLLVSDGAGTATPPSPPAQTILVRNKVDVGGATAGQVNVSARRGDGMEVLRAALTAEALRLAGGRGVPSLTRPRHRAAIAAARDHLREALEVEGAEFAVEALRLAGRALARITGEVDAEDVLDALFGSFCIGK